jgi:hypothetical protein
VRKPFSVSLSRAFLPTNFGIERLVHVTFMVGALEVIWTLEMLRVLMIKIVPTDVLVFFICDHL